ncbi:16S rRNA (uracil(1498)-N(3))-methyltransferase [Marinicella sediminis]|uniref:Ribosomal RNA small subunit methyltransferase E n=1 Tax=Marinicella sediminis TaxID=1792834 RepID=A0ABV7J8Y5_9GAMM|nr:16S rRNA (uracil(1498)-N(3))-methyltransferase [Marinicella sediminis]
MRISRIYLPETTINAEQEITIDGVKAHYIRNVLRLKINHIIEFFTPDGQQYQGTISDLGKHHVTLSGIQTTSNQPQPSSLQVTLVQGISSSDRMDYTVQKAAELGCQQLIPVLSEFCSQKIPPHKYEKKQQHWQAVAISACEQTGRSDLLHIQPVTTLEAITQNNREAIYLEPTATTKINQLPATLRQNMVIFVGPEGGFSPTELDRFRDAGYTGVVLGQRVLRTETVAPVILSALHTLYGDFS